MPPSVPVQQWGDAGGMRGCRAGCRGQRKEGWFWGIAVAGLAGGLQGLHALHVPARGPGSPFFPTMGTPRPRRRPRAVGSCRCFSSIPRKADFFLISFSGQSASFPAQALLGGLGNQGAWVGARPAPGDAAPRGPAGLVAARGGSHTQHPPCSSPRCWQVGAAPSTRCPPAALRRPFTSSTTTSPPGLASKQHPSPSSAPSAPGLAAGGCPRAAQSPALPAGPRVNPGSCSPHPGRLSCFVLLQPGGKRVANKD